MNQTLRGPDTAAINQRYDELFYARRMSEFSGRWGNFGYWTESTRTQAEACENQMEKLLSHIPVREGRILDVACGMGATSRHLARYWGPGQITGINISEKQLATCREMVPGATFRIMDAAHMEFEDASFDNMVCVEAAFHFDTRESFFREALRVLKPGGTLALSDVLLTREGARTRLVCTEKNHLDTPAEYADLFRRCGFEAVEVVDVTEECWNRHYRHLVLYAHEMLLKGEIELTEMQQYLAATYKRVPDIMNYLLAAGRKPKATSPGAR